MELAKGQGNATFREEPVKEFDTWDVDLWSSSSFSVLFDSPPSSRRVERKTRRRVPERLDTFFFFRPALLRVLSTNQAKTLFFIRGESTDATKVPTCLLDPSWLVDTPNGARIQHEPCIGRIA